MKKRLLHIGQWIGILFLLLFFLPFVEATITLQGPSQGKLSLGDELDLSGTLQVATDLVGLLKFDLVCNERQTILVKSLSLKANVQKQFAENIPLTQYFDGSCVVEAYLEVNGQTQEIAQSSQFAITQELLGDIKIDKTTVQLGESIQIDGTLTRPDGSFVTGTATISFKKESITYLQETVPVAKGVLSFSYDTQNNPAGTYRIEIAATDTYNNKQLFVIEPFTIQDNIVILLQTQENEFLPGESVKISGTATTGGFDIKDGLLSFAFEGQQMTTSIQRGSFKETIPLAKNIKTGEHVIFFVAEDQFGNREEGEALILVKAVPTLLTLTTNVDTLQPTEQLTIHPTLYDQGSDLIQTTVDLSLADAEGDIVFKQTLQNNEQTALTLPEDAVSGTWTLTATALGVEAENSLHVTERQSLTITREHEYLLLENKGNIPIKETFTLALISAFNPEDDRTFTKKISLDPGETAQIDLAVGTAKGMYKVTIGEQSFEDVEITATKIHFLPFLTFGGIIIFVLLLVWFSIRFFNKGKKKIHLPHQRELHRKLEHHQTLYRKPINEERAAHRFEQNMQERAEQQRRNLSWSMASKRKADEFVMELPKKSSRTAQAIERVYKQTNTLQEEYPVYGAETSEQKESVQTRNEAPPEKKKGLFSMFD